MVGAGKTVHGALGCSYEGQILIPGHPCVGHASAQRNHHGGEDKPQRSYTHAARLSASGSFRVAS